MSNKNPFEIREEVLSMAKDYMDNAWNMNIQLMNDMYEQGKASYEEVQAAYKPYSIEEMLKKAQEMYTFVSTK